MNALAKLQDLVAKAIAEAEPREARHNRQGYAEWVDRILNQNQGHRMAHNWTRGTPKAPPLLTAVTIEGIHDGHPSELGPKFQRE
eukprot:9178634-Karenia_brevis.AAC.1